MTIKKIGTIRQNTVKDSTIEHYNSVLHNAFIDKKIVPVLFNPSALKVQVEEAQNFVIGMKKYLDDVNKELDNVTDDAQLKSWAYQTIAELTTLVYPNAGTSYSLIPYELKKISWNLIIPAFEKKNSLSKDISSEDIDKIKKVFDHFFNKDSGNKNSGFPHSLICIVAKTLSGEFSESIKHNYLNSDSIDMVTQMPIYLKRSSWLAKLSYNLHNHIVAINYYKITGIDKLELKSSCKTLALEVTARLLDEQLLTIPEKSSKSIPEKSSKSIPEKSSKSIPEKSFKNQMFCWNGTHLLAFPKKLTLPMRYPPQDWKKDHDSGNFDGGFLLSQFTNISYQGYLDSKSIQMHNHILKPINSSTQINNLQKVRFEVNTFMLDFVKKYSFELTKNNVLYITDKWINPSEEVSDKVSNKWEGLPISAREIRKYVQFELMSKKNESYLNREILEIAELFRGYPIYWPAVHDFRGRIYRISNFNIQMNQFSRSLICFYSNNAPVTNRKKNKKTFEWYSLILQEILNDNLLFAEWDTIFGDRFINNNKFEQLLLKALLNEQISLLQVSQLLLLRHKEYDKIGIYYDASASAYQIMGALLFSKDLCTLTNVIKEQKPEGKKDLYEFFREELAKQLNETDDFKFVTSKGTDYMSHTAVKKRLEKIDRPLIKAVVMPLIYGKTAHGFAEDLRQFYAKDNKFPSESALFKLAHYFTQLLKNSPFLELPNQFMFCLRSFAKIMFDADSNELKIRGPYNDSVIRYNAVEKTRCKIYWKDSKDLKAGTKQIKINLQNVKKDKNNKSIPSRSKTANAFVANYIHFLDGQICHFVIEQLFMVNEKELGTIHDCFYIKPENAVRLRNIYTAGLVLSIYINECNFTSWIIELSQIRGISIEQELQDYIKSIKGVIHFLRKERRDYPMSTSEYRSIPICNEPLIKAIHKINQKTQSPHLDEVLLFLKNRNPEKFLTILKAINCSKGTALFPDNK